MKAKIMETNDEENRYEQVIKSLKQLKKVNAPGYFEADLLRRINGEEYKERKESHSGFFAPARIISSAVVFIVAVIVVFMIETYPTKQVDPLSVNPPLREGVLQENQSTEISSAPMVKQQMQKQNAEEKQHELQKSLPSKSKAFVGNNNSGSEEIPSPSASLYYESNRTPIAGITLLSGTELKEGLNYKQANLTKSERREVHILKQKMVESFRENSR